MPHGLCSSLAIAMMPRHLCVWIHDINILHVYLGIRRKHKTADGAHVHVHDLLPPMNMYLPDPIFVWPQDNARLSLVCVCVSRGPLVMCVAVTCFMTRVSALCVRCVCCVV